MPTQEEQAICPICFGGYIAKNERDHQCPEFYNCGACGEICDADAGTIENTNGRGFYGEFTHSPELCPAQDEIEEKMCVKNSVTIEFVTDRPLTEAEIETLQAILGLQIEEPQDLEGNEEEWTASNITTHHNAIEKED